MEKKRNHNKGFTLVELLIATAIVSIVMVMVTQFMSTTSATTGKTRKNLEIQTEAMEVGSQMSDALIQATYVRVQVSDDETSPVSKDLVVDNYPNYLSSTPQKIILDEATSQLLNAAGTAYQVSHDGTLKEVQSFRALTKGRTAGEPLYVKPKYIYMLYQRKIGGSPAEKAYVIFKFDGNKVFMDRGTYDSLGTTTADGFDQAVSSIDGKIAVDNGKSVLLTQHVSSYLFSADTEANTLFLDMIFDNPRSSSATFHYKETIMLRNSNVLTVQPQKMFKKP